MKYRFEINLETHLQGNTFTALVFFCDSQKTAKIQEYFERILFTLKTHSPHLIPLIQKKHQGNMCNIEGL